MTHQTFIDSNTSLNSGRSQELMVKRRCFLILNPFFISHNNSMHSYFLFQTPQQAPEGLVLGARGVLRRRKNRDPVHLRGGGGDGLEKALARIITTFFSQCDLDFFGMLFFHCRFFRRQTPPTTHCNPGD